MTTSKGRKRKLSCYRSKQKNPGNGVETVKHFKPNYVKIIHSEIDSDDEIIDVENSSGEIFQITDTSQNYSQNQSDETMETDRIVSNDGCECSEYSPTFKELCLKELKESDLLDIIVGNLYDTSQLHDFMCFLHDLKSGQLPSDNIVFLLLLEQVKFQNCCNTVAMRYGDRKKLFWTIVYRLCKGSGLKFFSGSKNWGQLVNKEAQKSMYDPDLSKINFAVPDEKVLCD